MDVLVIDVGGSSVKIYGPDEEPRTFESGPELMPKRFVSTVRTMTADWRYDVISIGFPGAVGDNVPAAEPGNLGSGWVGFDFAGAFDRPVRVVNDAVLHALGSYDGGRMLFLGLGTGLASALVSEHVVVPLELGNLPCGGRAGSLAERLGRAGLESSGRDVWLKDLADATRYLRDAFTADYVMLGGGNADQVAELPDHVRRVGRTPAYLGGLRLWEEMIEPHDRRPPQVWRVVR